VLRLSEGKKAALLLLGHGPALMRNCLLLEYLAFSIDTLFPVLSNCCCDGCSSIHRSGCHNALLLASKLFLDQWNIYSLICIIPCSTSPTLTKINIPVSSRHLTLARRFFHSSLHQFSVLITGSLFHSEPTPFQLHAYHPSPSFRFIGPSSRH